MPSDVVTGWDLHQIFAALNPNAKTAPRLAPADPPPTCDGVICGSLDTPIRSVMVCWMLTSANVQRAQALGANAILTHEPTFYTHWDLQRQYDNAPYVAARRDEIDKLGWLVYRVHDCWDLFPDYGVADRWAAALALGPRLGEKSGTCVYEYTAPMPQPDFARRMAAALGVEGVRLAGPDRPVKRVALGVGAWGGWHHLLAGADLGADIFVTGETCEWQVVRYAGDADLPMMVVGHNDSEEPGLKGLADWLAPQVSVPVRYVRTDSCYRVIRP